MRRKTHETHWNCSGAGGDPAAAPGGLRPEDAPAVTPTHTPAATASPHVSPEATPPVTATDTPVPGGTAEPGSVGDDLKDAARNAGDAVKDAAEGVGDAVRGAAHKAKNAADDMLRDGRTAVH